MEKTIALSRDIQYTHIYLCIFMSRNSSSAAWHKNSRQLRKTYLNSYIIILHRSSFDVCL